MQRKSSELILKPVRLGGAPSTSSSPLTMWFLFKWAPISFISSATFSFFSGFFSCSFRTSENRIKTEFTGQPYLKPNHSRGTSHVWCHNAVASAFPLTTLILFSRHKFCSIVVDPLTDRLNGKEGFQTYLTAVAYLPVILVQVLWAKHGLAATALM